MKTPIGASAPDSEIGVELNGYAVRLLGDPCYARLNYDTRRAA